MFIDPPPDDFWTVSFALDPPAPVRFVSAAGGLVVAAGASLHTLRPGSQHLGSRPLPTESEVLAIAAEPWTPYRMAIATPTSVGIYSGHRPYASSHDIELSSPEVAATHLAWIRREGSTSLYLRQRTRQVMMVNLDDQTTAMLMNAKADAIAGDEQSVFGMINLTPTEGANVGESWILPASAAKFDVRWVDCGTPDGEMEYTRYLAVYGAALAYATTPRDETEHCGHAMVSWESDEDDGHTFEMAPGVFRGPLAFQNERTIFGAYNVEGRVSVLRWERGGSFTRIAHFGMADNFVDGTPATVTALAWDKERRVLWAASPELGLIKLTEPPHARGPAGKKVAAN